MDLNECNVCAQEAAICAAQTERIWRKEYAGQEWSAFPTLDHISLRRRLHVSEAGSVVYAYIFITCVDVSVCSATFLCNTVAYVSVPHEIYLLDYITSVVLLKKSSIFLLLHYVSVAVEKSGRSEH